jgi:peroxiredoxin
MKPFRLAVLFLALAGAAAADPAAPLQVGDPAPGFVLPYATRDSIARDSLSLAGLVGRRNVVLAFYPADWSGGCTKEVCTLRDNFTALGALNADVVGISGDYVFSHHEWARHHDLPFRLASDHRHEVAKAYGSYNDAAGFNRRTVFVVGRDGRIAYVDLAYSVRDSVSFGKLRSALAGAR